MTDVHDSGGTQMYFLALGSILSIHNFNFSSGLKIKAKIARTIEGKCCIRKRVQKNKL